MRRSQCNPADADIAGRFGFAGALFVHPETRTCHMCVCAFSCPLSSSMMMLQVIPEPKHRIQRSWNPQSQTSSQPRHERTPRVYIRNQSCIFITQTLKLRRSLFMSFLPDKETRSHALPVASDVCFASTDRCTWQMLSCGYNIDGTQICTASEDGG